MERRNTIQRELVLEAVRTLGNHARADEVYAYVAQNHPSIGRGTVYRNLNVLAEEGAIKKLEVPSGPDCYDHDLSEHYHVGCVSCGRVFDVDMAAFADMREYIRDCRGFKFLGCDIFFKGICPACQKSAKKEVCGSESKSDVQA